VSDATSKLTLTGAQVKRIGNQTHIYVDDLELVRNVLPDGIKGVYASDNPSVELIGTFDSAKSNAPLVIHVPNGAPAVLAVDL
jgi:hypothetical protein